MSKERRGKGIRDKGMRGIAKGGMGGIEANG